MFFLIFGAIFAGCVTFGGAVLGVIAYLRQTAMGERLARLEARVAAPAEPAQVPVAPVEAVAPPPIRDMPPLPPRGETPVGEAPAGGMRWLEELAGGRLSVLLGGLALALGGVFLVRYTIEQGLLGPAGRIFLGVVFSAALAAGGEYLRRGDLQAGRTAPVNAYVPGALTGAAIVSAFATIYAAYALYGFIGPTFAFILLAACALAGLAVSSIHGPGLAALGLLGSYATPLLINTDRPNAWLLFGYLLIVTFACLFTAHLRRWLWLAIAASVAADAWAVLWILGGGVQQPWAQAVYVTGLTALAVLLLHRKDSDDAAAAPRDWPLSWLLAGHGAATTLVAFGDQLAAPSFWAIITVSLVLGWAGWTFRSLALAPAIGGLTTVLAYIGARNPLEPLLHGAAALPPDTPTGLLWTGALLGAGYGAGATAGFFSRRSNAVWPCLAAAAPLAIFVYSYWFSTWFHASSSFALLGAGLAIAYAVAAENAHKRPAGALTDWGAAIYAAAAVAALALGLAMVLEKGWLTVALAAMAPGLALIERRRPVPVLRWLIAGLAGLVALRLLTEPSILGGSPGATPLFNWLLYAYGLPAAAFWYAGRELVKRRDDLPVKLAEGAALMFLAGLIGTEIRHLMTGGSVTGGTASLGEYGLHTLSWLGLSIGLRLRSGGDAGRLVPRYGALLFGGLGSASMLINTLLLQNPVVTGMPVGGGALLNDLLLAYLLPAMLGGVLYRLMKSASPWWLKTAPATAGLVMAFAYVTLETARWFEGPVVSMSHLDPGELYALSVVWLLFALGLLTAGIGFGNAILRQAAFGVLLLVTLKVFLVDLAGLTGLLQAGSFIGLGLALVGIGLAYQRLVLRAAKAPPQA